MSTHAAGGPSGLWRAWLRMERRRPRQTALVDLESGSRSFTRSELGARAREAAVQLPSGIRLAALALPNSPDWIIWFLATQARGIAVVPLDASQPDGAQRAAALRLGAGIRITPQGVETLPRGRCRIPAGTAVVKLTSGSTGLPKAWPCRAAHLLADGRHVCATMGIRPSDRNLGLIPLGHSYGLGNLVLPLILQGTALAVAPSFVPSQLGPWITRHRLTVFPTVPAVLRILAQLPGACPPPLRTVISAGAPLPPETARAFLHTHRRRVHNFYGSSETGGIAYDRTGTASLSGASLGSPLRGVRVKISPSGRVAVSSRAVLTRNGTHLLPDRGELRADGALRLLGRAGRVANLGGKKVALAEIEQALQAIPGVREALAWVEHRGGREILCAAVECDLPRVRLETALAGRLSPWKLPRVLHTAPTLPRTTRGKIDRSAL